MRTYRIHILNVKGQIKKARYFICNDDSDALSLAQRILGTKGAPKSGWNRLSSGEFRLGILG